MTDRRKPEPCECDQVQELRSRLKTRNARLGELVAEHAALRDAQERAYQRIMKHEDQVQELRRSLAKAHAATSAALAQLRAVQSALTEAHEEVAVLQGRARKAERGEELARSEAERTNYAWNMADGAMKRARAERDGLNAIIARCLAKMPEAMMHGGCLETAVDLLLAGLLMPIGAGAELAREYDELLAIYGSGDTEPESVLAQLETQLRAPHGEGWMGVVSDMSLGEAQMLSEKLLSIAGEGLEGLLVALLRNRSCDQDGTDRAKAAVKDALRLIRGETVSRAKGAVTALWQSLWLNSRDLNQDVAEHDVSPDNPLDDPRMDGKTWIPAEDVTRAMLDAWPVWEVIRRNCADRVVRPHIVGHETAPAHGSQWRPLRLPGMNSKGEIQAKDMREEFFERVREWEWRHAEDTGVCGEWNDTMGPGHFTGAWSMAEVGDASDELWRPAIFAKLDHPA